MKLRENKINSLVDILIFFCYMIEPERKCIIVEDDPSDNKIIECAIEANANYIITGDEHLLSIREVGTINNVSAADFSRKWKRCKDY